MGKVKQSINSRSDFFFNSCISLVGFYIAVITPEESQRISLFLGYILGMFGLIQAVCMIYLFPSISHTMGLLPTGVIGAFIIGLTFWCISFAQHEAHIVYIYIGKL